MMAFIVCGYNYATPDGLTYSVRARIQFDAMPYKSVGYGDIFIPKEYYDAWESLGKDRYTASVNHPITYTKTLEYRVNDDETPYNCYSMDWGSHAFCEDDELVYPVLSYTRELKEE